MKLKNIIYAAALTSVLAMTTGCAEDYQELNQDPSNVTKVDPKGFMAQAVLKFQPNDYLLWWYNVSYFTRWTQMAMPSNGYTAEFTGLAENGGQGSQYVETLTYRNAIRQYIDNTGETQYKAYESVCTMLSIYLGIFDTDIYGDRPYTAAAMYDGTPASLTPKYDRVEDLYTLWLSELDECVKYFQDEKQEFVPSQDVVYHGDKAKWAKAANSLKLRIAARLYNNNPEKAKQIAENVVSSDAGYMQSLDDDMLFCKATASSSGGDTNDFVYGTGNDLATPCLSNNVLKFMLDAKDPRVRFIYTKNSFNSKVVQGFIDAGKFDQLPTAVKENVVLDEDGNFKEWGGMGEPWVRYTGLPVVLDGQFKDEYNEWFKAGDRYALTVDDVTKTYNHISYQSEEMKRGRANFTLPTVGGLVIEDTEDKPLYTMYITSGEVNLLLAEFKLLGANLPKDAETYYQLGVENSVREYDKLASLNKIPYYGNTYGYDPNEKVIDLQEGEIEAMLATPAVQLTGSNAEKLEKVYLQLLMHYNLLPDDQFVTARRSGYPKIGSALLPMVKFEGIALTAIPRRFEIANPSPTDIMRGRILEAIDNQDFTPGTNQSGSAFNATGTVLNTERVWQDKNAPQWGTPK